MTLFRLSDAAVAAVSESLGPALVVSLTLHVALLAGLPDLWTLAPVPAAAPLEARIEPAAGEPAETPATPVAPAAGAPVASAVARGIAPPRVRALERPTPRPPRPEPAAESAPDAPAAESAPDAPAEPPRASGVERPPAIEPARSGAAQSDLPLALAGADPTLPPGPGDGASDLDALAQYRHALAGAARRLKVYPPYAAERGWEGKVAVQLVIGADGELAGTEVKSSSGYSILDRQAVETLRMAKRLTPIPPALAHREFTVKIVISFGLTDG